MFVWQLVITSNKENIKSLHYWPFLRGITIAWWCHDMEKFAALMALCEGNPPVISHWWQWLITSGFPSQRAINAANVSMLSYHHIISCHVGQCYHQSTAVVGLGNLLLHQAYHWATCVPDSPTMGGTKIPFLNSPLSFFDIIRLYARILLSFSYLTGVTTAELSNMSIIFDM